VPQPTVDGPYEHCVVARMWEYIEPVARGARYEDPLQDVLAAKKIGEVTGGGTQLGVTPGIEFVEIEMYLADCDGSIQSTAAALGELGAPVGSELQFERDGVKQTVPFGTTECVAVFLDGQTLPMDVYETSDVNVVIRSLLDALGNLGEFRSHWGGNEETALFFYGTDAEQMYTAIFPVLSSQRLCQNARIVRRFGRHPKGAIESRMPRNE
jgi:hypothetical protein